MMYNQLRYCTVYFIKIYYKLSTKNSSRQYISVEQDWFVIVKKTTKVCYCTVMLAGKVRKKGNGCTLF